MSYREVLREIEHRGLSVELFGPDLWVQGDRTCMDPEFVARLRAAKPDLIHHLRQVELHGPGFPLTPLQHARLRTGDPGAAGGHVYHEIEGCWDVDRLQEALAAVVDAHSGLRSRFSATGRQITEIRGCRTRISRLDLRAHGTREQTRIRGELREERVHRTLPVDRAPLLAVEVTVLADDRMVLHVSHDGLVMDGASMFLFFRAWWQEYAQHGRTRTAPPEELLYEEYVAALEEACERAPARRAREYWLARIDGLAPAPRLPLRAGPLPAGPPRFSQRRARLDREAWAALKERAADAGLTVTVVLLAAYAQTLARWGAGARFTLGATVPHRPPVHPRIRHAIGQYSDLLLVEAEVDRSLTFAERARLLHARLREDLAHRDHSGVLVLRELARRAGAPAALMPYAFCSAVEQDGGADGSALELFGPEVHTVSQSPQTWLTAFAMEQHGALVVQLDGIDALFPEGLLDALALGYQALLRELTDRLAWQRTLLSELPDPGLPGHGTRPS